MTEKQLHDYYKKGLETELNSIYGVTVQKELTRQFILPVVELKSSSFALEGETLSKTDKIYRFSYDVSIYAENIPTDTGMLIAGDVADELKGIVYNYFEGEGFSCTSSIRLNNLDTDVARRFVRVEGLYRIESDILYRG